MKIKQIVDEYQKNEEGIVEILRRNKVNVNMQLITPKVLDTKVVYEEGLPTEKQYHVQTHDVFSKTLRPDKHVKAKDETGAENNKIQKVNRVGIEIQKKIVTTAVSFLFGNPVNITANTLNDIQAKILNSFKKILKKNKIDTFNRVLAKDLFRSCEIAEIWFTVDAAENEYYGFKTKNRIKVKLASNWLGDTLYPLFDEQEDLIAFGREYTKNGDLCFEVYTSDEFQRLVKSEIDNTWKVEVNIDNKLKKIPVIYARQDFPEWSGVQSAIDRLETLLSNFADTNDYHASPKIFVKGKILGFAQKGEQGAILQGDEKAEMKYLSWNDAPVSVKTEIDNLYQIIYSMTQTPDLSFENLKKVSIGNVSGKVLQFLFLDAQLKVMEKREIFDAYLERRSSVVLSIMAMLNPSFAKEVQSIELQTEIVPFNIEDLSASVDLLMKANGDKPLISHESSVLMAQLTSDPEEEYKLIQAEVQTEEDPAPVEE